MGTVHWRDKKLAILPLSFLLQDYRFFKSLFMVFAMKRRDKKTF